jgi:hypothetical protein
MRDLDRRLIRLERHTVKLDDQPIVIRRHDPETRELIAVSWGGNPGGRLVRDDDETVEAFAARVEVARAPERPRPSSAEAGSAHGGVMGQVSSHTGLRPLAVRTCITPKTRINT